MDRTPLLIAVLIILIFVIGTFERNEVWSSEKRLWFDTVSKSPLKPRPRINLAYAYQREGDMYNAIHEYNNAKLLNLSHSRSTWEKERNRRFIAINVGQALLSIGQTQDAVKLLADEWNREPGHPGLAINLGIGFVRLGRMDLALATFQAGVAALETREYPGFPDPAILYNDLAMAYKAVGNCPLYFDNLREAKERSPDFIQVIAQCP